MQVDVIILSKCSTIDDFHVTNNCINSLVASEDKFDFNIFLIESNPDFKALNLFYDFPSVKIIKPNLNFNFNKFLNIGLSYVTCPWVIFSNNDIIFHKNWLTEIFKVKEINSAIQSFCPFDRKSPYLSFEKYNKKDYHTGYNVPVEFVGWCFVLDRTIFETVNKFDETFDLYFQDNDFALTLKKHSIVHAMVPNSFVEHIGGHTTKNIDASSTQKYQIDKAKFINKWQPSYRSMIRTKLAALKKIFNFD